MKSETMARLLNRCELLLVCYGNCVACKENDCLTEISETEEELELLCEECGARYVLIKDKQGFIIEGYEVE